MHNEVPGVNVTPEILERMRVASDKSKEARPRRRHHDRPRISAEVSDVIQGVQVSAPFGNVKYALQVFDVLGKKIEKRRRSFQKHLHPLRSYTATG